MKFPNDLINDLTNQLGDIINQRHQLKDDAKSNIKALLQAQLSKLDLVSRDEFDSQKQVLLRTREKLEKLEQQIATLETKMNNDSL